MFFYTGFQANALIAASCCPKEEISFIFLKSQINNWLSLPPEAMYLLSGENFRPQISYKWPAKLYIGSQDFDRTSKSLIILSLDPETNRFSCQCKDPILEVFTNSLEIILFFWTSVMIIYPLESEVAKYLPSSLKSNEQI